MDVINQRKLDAAHAGHKYGRFLPVLAALQLAFDLWVVIHGR